MGEILAVLGVVVLTIGIYGTPIFIVIGILQWKIHTNRPRTPKLDFASYKVITCFDSDTKPIGFTLDIIGRDAELDTTMQQGALYRAENTYHVVRHLGNRKQSLLLSVPHTGIRGYFLQEASKYTEEIWVHLTVHDFWYVLRIRYGVEEKSSLQFQFLNPLSRLVPSEQWRAFKAIDRPQHLGSTKVHALSKQNSQWTLDEPRQLFLTPLYLVVMTGEAYVLYTIKLESISHVEYLRDVKHDWHILRLTVDGAYQAYMVKDAKRWQNAIRSAQAQLAEVS